MEISTCQRRSPSPSTASLSPLSVRIKRKDAGGAKWHTDVGMNHHSGLEHELKGKNRTFLSWRRPDILTLGRHEPKPS
jgi:hypothetical protein